MSTSTSPHSTSPSFKNPAAWLVIVFIFLGSLFLFTRHNTFPYTYHPDEDTKVRQILTGSRNFYHPLLMLTTTDMAVKISRIQNAPEAVAVIGRWVSATFTALAICSFAVLAWRWTGWIGGVVTAILLSLDPLVFELAHYFKEDPALLLGITVTFLAIDIFWANPGLKSATFLGLGCALAISGKYLGAVVLLFAIIPLVLHSRKMGWQLFAWFALGFLIPLFLINLPLFLDLSDFQKGLSREMEGATDGHRGIGQKVPHLFYVERMAELTPWGLWIGVLLAVGVASWQYRRWVLARWLTVIFPVFFFVLLSFSPKTAGRYLLPVEAFASFLAAIGLASMLRKEMPALWRCFGVICFAVVAFGSGSEFSRYYKEFSHDDRSDLRIWLTNNTENRAVVAEDGRVDLQADATWKARPVESSEYVADLGTLEELQARGITHVAVVRQTYNRYFNKKLTPNPTEKVEFEARSAFYRRLFHSGKLVWESPLGDVIYLHPGIRVYEIGKPMTKARADSASK